MKLSNNKELLRKYKMYVRAIIQKQYIPLRLGKRLYYIVRYISEVSIKSLHIILLDVHILVADSVQYETSRFTWLCTF